MNTAMNRGSAFLFDLDGTLVDSVYQHVEPLRLIAWTSKTLGIMAIHFWYFEPRGNGTFIRTEESYEWLVARLLRESIQKQFDRGLANGPRFSRTEVKWDTDSRKELGNDRYRNEGNENSLYR